MTPHAHKANGSEDLVSHLEHAAENAGRYARKVFEETTDGTNDLTDAIREKPVKAALIALGIGVVLGALLRR